MVCRRIGGAFGGKASRSMPVAAAAAVAASKLRRRVRLVLNRNQDMRQNGGEEPAGSSAEEGAVIEFPSPSVLHCDALDIDDCLCQMSMLSSALSKQG